MPAISGTCRPGPPLHPEGAGQLGPERRLEHLAGRPGVPVQVGVGERRPLAVGPLDEVGDQHVPVQQRVPGPRRCGAGTPRRPPPTSSTGAVPTADGSSPAAASSARFLSTHAMLCEPRCTSIASRSSQPIASRTAWSPASMTAPCTRGSSDTAYSTLADFGTLNVASNPGTRCGCGRIVVPFGDSPPAARRHPRQHRPQIVGADLAVEAEPGRSPTDPLPRRLAGARVVGVERLGDPRQLVGLLADPQLGQRRARGEHERG